MKKILFILLLLTNVNSINAMEVYDDSEAATTNVVEVVEEKPVDDGVMYITEEPVDRNVEEVKPEYRSEEEVEPTEYTEDNQEILEKDIRTTALVDENSNDKLIIYGVAGAILVASGLAIYFYNKRRKVA